MLMQNVHSVVVDLLGWDFNMAVCDRCSNNIRRYNGRQVECKRWGRVTQQPKQCPEFVAKFVKRVDMLAWAE